MNDSSAEMDSLCLQVRGLLIMLERDGSNITKVAAMKDLRDALADVACRSRYRANRPEANVLADVLADASTIALRDINEGDE